MEIFTSHYYWEYPSFEGVLIQPQPDVIGGHLSDMHKAVESVLPNGDYESIFFEGSTSGVHAVKVPENTGNIDYTGY